MFKEVNIKFKEIVSIESNDPNDDDVTLIYLINGRIIEVKTSALLLCMMNNGSEEYISDFLNNYDVDKYGETITIINDTCNNTQIDSYDYVEVDVDNDEVIGLYSKKQSNKNSTKVKKHF